METGKIYWLLGDFKILNSDDPDYWHSVAKVEEVSWVVSPELIRFHTIPADFNTGDLIAYSLELQPYKDNNYAGVAKNSDSGEFAAEVKCELFENSKKHLLKGTWIEEGENGNLFFTWILILDKNKKK
ncbi:hypothetical protein [Shivajiella indica]|uniref:Uncharacterized protein n=1 Tax=Shivajiella indica TaxID=872115 RepID=A0ABW5B629_9BACT